MPVSPGQTVQFSIYLRNPTTFAPQNIDANTTLSAKTIYDSIITNDAVTVSSGTETGKYNLAFTINNNQTIPSRVQVRASAQVANQTETAIVFEDTVDATVNSRSILGAGAQMDLVSAPNATAVTAIQNGLSKPGTDQNVSAISVRTALGMAAANMDTQLGGIPAAVWAAGTRTLTSFGTLVADMAAAVWGAATRTLTAVSDSSGVTTLLTRLTQAIGFDAGGNVKSAPQTGVSTLTVNDVGDALTTFGAATTTEVTSARDSVLGRLGTPVGASVSADIAAVKSDTAAGLTISQQIATGWTVVNGKIVFTATALANAPTGSGGGSITVTFTPVTATVSAGEIASDPIVAYQNASATYTFNIVDADGNPIDLSGKTVQFVAAVESALDTPLIIRDNDTNGGLSVGGDGNNAVTVTLTPTHTTTIRTLKYALWNVTDEKPLGENLLEIRPISQYVS